MRHYLSFIADGEDVVWRGFSRSLMGMGAFFVLGAGSSYFASPRWEGERKLALGFGAGGLAMLGVGLSMTMSKSPGQKALEAFEAELRASPENRALAVARTESYLDGIGTRERTAKWVSGGLLVGLAAAGAVSTTVQIARHELTLRHPTGIVVGYAGAALLGLTVWQIVSTETFSERVLRLYRQDPDLKARFALAPFTAAGGYGLALTGAF
jgi:hypothetical protein